MTKRGGRYGAEYKFQVALDAAKALKTLNELSGEYGVHPNQIKRWKGELLKGGATVFCNKSACTRACAITHQQKCTVRERFVAGQDARVSPLFWPIRGPKNRANLKRVNAWPSSF